MKSSLWKILIAALPASGICADFGLPWGAEYIVNAPGFHTASVVRDGSQRVGALGSISNGTKTAAGVSFLGNGGIWAQAPFVITNEFSVGVWFNTSVNSNMALFGANMGAGQSYVDLSVGGSGFTGTATNAYFIAGDTNRPLTDFVRIATNPRDGKDHLLTATMDASVVRIYIDGIEQAQTARTANSSGLIKLTNAPTWGAMNLSPTSSLLRYSGELGMGAIWFRALTSNEVRRWYVDGIGLEAIR